MNKKEYNKIYYQLNKTLESGTIKQKREMLKKWKVFKTCKICGFDENGVSLDFHHKDENLKKFMVSQMLRLSIEELKREMKKCVVLCANHHRIEHWG